MTKLFFFLLLIPSLLLSYTVPVMSNGRIRPLDIEMGYDNELKVLPSKLDWGTWLPLNTLTQTKKNVSAYPDEIWNQLQAAYESNQFDKLSQLLETNYSQLSGKAYRTGSHSELRFPTIRQLKAETLYTQVPWMEMTLFLYGLALMLLFFKPRWGLGTMMAAFGMHTWILALRCFILGRPPVSNMFETVLYVPWIAVLLGFILWGTLKHKGPLIASGCGALILLFLIAPPHHELENVQAVLNSQYWLIIHVLMVVGSYGAFILSGLIAHYYLIKRLTYPPSPEVRWMLHALYVGVVLLISGTILGGVWAAQSWGRFWDWDPKESWAFISSCLYLVVIHAYRFGKIGDLGLAFGSIIGLQAITFTWYGVNYILGVGLHSYGFGNGGELFYLLFVGLEALFLISLAVLHRKVKKIPGNPL